MFHLPFTLSVIQKWNYILEWLYSQVSCCRYLETKLHIIQSRGLFQSPAKHYTYNYFMSSSMVLATLTRQTTFMFFYIREHFGWLCNAKTLVVSMKRVVAGGTWLWSGSLLIIIGSVIIIIVAHSYKVCVVIYCYSGVVTSQTLFTSESA